MLITLTDLLTNNPRPTEQEVIDAVSGNLCRCTGYQQILDAAHSAIARSQS
jgi:carbon-monoxide dehydrogenase small subunit